MKVEILEHKFELIVEDPAEWADTGMGRSSLLSGQIRLRKNLPLDAFDATLLHEVVHMISEILDLGMDKERTVSGVATGILSFIRQNPRLVQQLIRPQGGSADGTSHE